MSSGAETAGVLIDAVGGELRLALAELRELARGGTLSDLSPAGAGTTVRAVIPLDGRA
jgi:hypothetical protein